MQPELGLENGAETEEYLETVLEETTDPEVRFHVRQALQHLRWAQT